MLIHASKTNILGPCSSTLIKILWGTYRIAYFTLKELFFPSGANTIEGLLLPLEVLHVFACL